MSKAAKKVKLTFKETGESDIGVYSHSETPAVDPIASVDVFILDNGTELRAHYDGFNYTDYKVEAI